MTNVYELPPTARMIEVAPGLSYSRVDGAHTYVRSKHRAAILMDLAHSQFEYVVEHEEESEIARLIESITKEEGVYVH